MVYVLIAYLVIGSALKCVSLSIQVIIRVHSVVYVACRLVQFALDYII